MWLSFVGKRIGNFASMYYKTGRVQPTHGGTGLEKLQTLLGAVVDDNGALVQLGANIIDSDQSPWPNHLEDNNVSISFLFLSDTFMFPVPCSFSQCQSQLESAFCHSLAPCVVFGVNGCEPIQVGKWTAHEELLLQAIHPSLQRCWERLDLSILGAKSPYGHRIYDRHCWSSQALPCHAISPTCQRIVSKSFSWLHISRRYGGDWRSNLKGVFFHSISSNWRPSYSSVQRCTPSRGKVRDVHNGLIRTWSYSYTCIRKHPQR